MAATANSEDDYVPPPSGLEIISSLLTLPPPDYTLTASLAAAFAANDLPTFTTLTTTLLHPYLTTLKHTHHFTHRPPFQEEDLFCLRSSLRRNDTKTFTLLLLPAHALIIHLPASTQTTHATRWHAFLTLPNEPEGDRLLLADLEDLRIRYAVPRLQRLEAEIEKKKKVFAEMEREIRFRLQQNWEWFAFLPQPSLRVLALGLIIRVWFVTLASRGFVALGGEDAFASFGIGSGAQVVALAVVLGVWMLGVGMIGGSLFRGLRIAFYRTDGILPLGVSVVSSVSRYLVYGLLALLPLLCLRISKSERRLGRAKDGERAWRAMAVVEVCSWLLEWVLGAVKSKVMGFWFPRRITTASTQTTSPYTNVTATATTAIPATDATATANTTVNTTHKKNFSFGNQHLTFPLGMILFWTGVYMQDVVSTLGSANIQVEGEVLRAVQKRLLQMAIIFIAARLGRQIFYVRGFGWISLAELR